MLKFGRIMKVAMAASLAAFVLSPSAQAASKGGKCVVKAAEGTGADESTAKFQVDEALLQSVDWGAWAAWMASGSTPGYTFGKRTYKCAKGTGLGVTCRGSATICKA